MQPEITVSVVSHRQSCMVNALLGDLQRCARRVVLTLTENVSDDVPLDSLATNDVERAVGRAAVDDHVLKVIKILL